MTHFKFLIQSYLLTHLKHFQYFIMSIALFISAVNAQIDTLSDSTGILSGSDSTSLLSDSDSTSLLSDSDSTSLLSDSDSTGILSDSDSTGILSDSDSLVSDSTSTVDSLIPIKKNNLESDSTKKNIGKDYKSKMSLSLTKRPSYLSSLKGRNKSDTSFLIWNFPFFSGGIGWELGSLPLFDLWEEGLSSEKQYDIMDSHFPGDSNFDSLGVRSFSVVETPSVYNITYPISISYTPFVFKNKSFLSFGSTFSWNRKYLKTKFLLDSLSEMAVGDSILYFEQKLSLKSFAIDIMYHFLIPEKYFKVEKVKNSFITIGLTGYPVIILREWSKISLNPKKKQNSYGFGFGWCAGLSTCRKLSKSSGLKVYMGYLGSWKGRFKNNGYIITEGDISRTTLEEPNILTFISHRFILQFNLLVGIKKYQKGI